MLMYICIQGCTIICNKYFYKLETFRLTFGIVMDYTSLYSLLFEGGENGQIQRKTRGFT